MSESLDVAVIIVNFNCAPFTIEAIKSVYEHTKSSNFEIIVVDNNSEDDSPLKISNEFPAIKLIRNQSNMGFGAANNIAARQTNANYLFFLNPDTLLKNDAINYFHQYALLNSNTNLGCVGAYLEDAEGNMIHSFGPFLSYYYDLFYAIGYSIKKLLYLRAIHFIQPRFDKSLTEKDVDYITGADMFIGQDVFHECGGFDEQFFMYSEETDLQFRMSLKNLRRVVIPGPRIVHLEGKSFSISNHRRIMMAVSKLKYIRKHKGFVPWAFMKSVYLIAAILELISDLYNCEYSLKENQSFVISLIKERYY